jgi:hypothetical protein
VGTDDCGPGRLGRSRLDRDRRLGRRGGGLGFGLDDRLPLQPPRVGQAADTVRRRLVDARRVTLHSDLELVGKLDHDGVVNAELSCQLVDPNLLRRQNSPFP